MRLQKTRRLFNKIGVILVVLSPILFSLFVISVLAYASTFLTIGRIECKTEYGVCSKALEVIFQPAVGKSLLLTGRGEINKLSLGHSEVESLSIRKKLPDTLVVAVHVRKPRVAIVENGKFLLVDIEGKIISETDKSTLPKINLHKDLSEISPEDARWMIETMSNLFSLGITTRGELNNGDLILKIVSFQGETGETRSVEAVLGKARDPVLIAGSLQFMLNQFKMSGKQPVAIDLRFKNPVVVFEN